jgi:hypothetical protein
LREVWPAICIKTVLSIQRLQLQSIRTGDSHESDYSSNNVWDL